MAIILKNIVDGSDNLELDSNTIIGIIGDNSNELLDLLYGRNVFLLKKEYSFKSKIVKDELLSNYLGEKENFLQNNSALLKKIGLKEDFVEKEVDSLSSSEKRIFQYLLCLVSNKSVIIIDEPFLYLDYNWKKKITSLIKELLRSNQKTIIIFSDNSDIIYSLCKKVLFVKEDKCYYGDIKEVFTNDDLLKKYHIRKPEIVQFVDLVSEKKVKIDYVTDIRDLIKEVYKSV